MFEDIAISVMGGIAGGALYVAFRARVFGWFRRAEDRHAGLKRYQAFKDGT